MRSSSKVLVIGPDDGPVRAALARALGRDEGVAVVVGRRDDPLPALRDHVDELVMSAGPERAVLVPPEVVFDDLGRLVTTEKLKKHEEKRMIKRDDQGRVIEFEDESVTRSRGGGLADLAKSAPPEAVTVARTEADVGVAYRERLAAAQRRRDVAVAQVEAELAGEVARLDDERSGRYRQVDAVYREALREADLQRDRARESAAVKKLVGRQAARRQFYSAMDPLNDKVVRAREEADRQLESDLAGIDQWRGRELARIATERRVAEVAGQTTLPGGGS